MSPDELYSGGIFYICKLYFLSISIDVCTTVLATHSTLKMHKYSQTIFDLWDFEKQNNKDLEMRK